VEEAGVQSGFGRSVTETAAYQYQRKYYGCQDKFIKIELRLLHFENFALSNMRMPIVWQHQINSLTLHPARCFVICKFLVQNINSKTHIQEHVKAAFCAIHEAQIRETAHYFWHKIKP